MAALKPEVPGAEERPIDRLLSPILAFLKIQASGGLLLLGCTIIALVWANSPWRDSYEGLWNLKVTAGIGDFEISKALRLWVNDGLMAIFFFVVGLEIKRELLVGELSSPAKASIAIAGAIGGMLVPAAIYALINFGGEGMNGWAIPAATDIAFALGILALAGPHVPVGLKIFVMAAAIVDDLGAVLIIALFYTQDINGTALGAGIACFVLLIVANRLHMRQPIVYTLLTIAMWVAFLKSGVHATVAGVLAALTVPSRCRIDGKGFVEFARKAIDDFAGAGGDAAEIMTNESRQTIVQKLDAAVEHVRTPLLRFEHALHPWSSFFIMPVFALANAGVAIQEGFGDALTGPVSLGIILALVFGKPIGVVLFSWIAIRLGFGQLPDQTNWKQFISTGFLTGVGFTMSLFIAGLGFGEGPLLEQAKIGILVASLVAGVTGFVLLRRTCRPPACP